MLEYMGFLESLKRNHHYFKQKLIDCIDIPSAQEKVKSVNALAKFAKFSCTLNLVDLQYEYSTFQVVAVRTEYFRRSHRQMH